MWYYLAALALFFGNFFLHKPISDVCDAIRARIGFGAYDRGALIGFFVLAAMAVAPVAARRRAVLTEPTTFAVLVALAAMTVASQHWLLVTNIELVHFPQFALIAWLLWAGGLSPQTAWAGGTIAGVFDEFYQHLVIYADRADVYLDYNDMVLNSIGAAWVIVLLGAGATRSAAEGGADVRRFRWWPVLLVAAGVALGAWIDPPTFDPLLRPAPAARSYRVLSLGEGVLAIGILWGLVAVSTSARPRPADLTDGDGSGVIET